MRAPPEVLPSQEGTVENVEDCARAWEVLGVLLDVVGVTRHPGKGTWNGERKLENFRVRTDTERVHVYKTEWKVLNVKYIAQKLLLLAQRNRGLVP